MKTLLVDHEGSELGGLETLLRSRGYQVTRCLDLETTETLFQEQVFPWVWIGIPEKPDFHLQLCRKLRSRFPSLFCISVVAQLPLDFLQELIEEGVDDYWVLSGSEEEFQRRLMIWEQQIQRRQKALVRVESVNPPSLLPLHPEAVKSAALKQFPYIASHHLRQTLIQFKNQLTDLLEQPRQTPLDPEASHYLLGILDRANLMQQLVGDLLIDTQSQLQEIKPQPVIHQDYLIVDRRFMIKEFSENVTRFSDGQKIISKGQDLRDAFPEFTGSEHSLIDIFNNRQKSFELPGVARFDGTENILYFDIHVTKYPENLAGETCLIVLLNNATERMIFQQKLIQSANEAQLLLKRLTTTKDYINQIILSMADALIVTTKTGLIKKINPATQKLLEYREFDLLGHPITKIFAPHYFETLQDQQNHSVVSQTEIICRKKNGEEISVSFSCSQIETAEDLLEFVYVGRDITERKQAEAKIKNLNLSLQERTQELEFVNEELESFSRTVSHDLKTPLSHIEFFSQMLMEEYAEQLDAEGQDYVEQIVKSCARMRQMIHDLLQLAHVNRTELIITSVHLSQMADNILQNLQRKTPQRQVSYSVDPDLITQGNEGLLEIALENLLGNAWKYTSKQPQATIHFGSLVAQNLDLHLVKNIVLDPEETVYFIQDNGAGFNMSYADKLFTAFGRLHSQRDFEGTGIGLTTVQRIIQRHGGKIWAEGQVNQGATFYFTLNLH